MLLSQSKRPERAQYTEIQETLFSSLENYLQSSTEIAQDALQSQSLKQITLDRFPYPIDVPGVLARHEELENALHEMQLGSDFAENVRQLSEKIDRRIRYLRPLWRSIQAICPNEEVLKDPEPNFYER